MTSGFSCLSFVVLSLSLSLSLSSSKMRFHFAFKSFLNIYKRCKMSAFQQINLYLANYAIYA